VEQAVPLSRQLIAMPATIADLATAEGRARMLAQARPLWGALPEGALRMQLLGDLARAAQMSADDLGAMWQVGRQAAAPRVDTRPPAGAALSLPTRRPLRSAGRPVPAASADLAVRLLLRHADWWDRLAADDHHLLHDLGGEHGALVGWLEQQLTDHGTQTWAALAEALQGHDLEAAAVRIVDPASLDDRHEFEDLQRVLHRLWVATLGDEVRADDCRRA
jgi:DNA primase